METITKRFNEKEFRTYVTALQGGIDDANTICDIIVSVAKEMDGKVYNVRFINRINAEIAGLGCCGRIEFICGKVYKMAFYLRDRDVQIGSRTVYYDDVIRKDIYFGLTSQLAINAEGRINATGFAEACQSTINTNKRTMRKYIDAHINWEQNIAIMNDIEETVREKAKGLNPLFLDLDTASHWMYANMYEIADKRF